MIFYKMTRIILILSIFKLIATEEIDTATVAMKFFTEENNFTLTETTLQRKK